jgi:C4-dicarboxylate transporter, DctQ subunit
MRFQLNRLLDHLEEWLISLLIAAATLIIFLAVVHRFCSGVPLLQPYTAQLNMSWAQELCIFMFVWMAKFGAAYGVRVGTHVGVDLLVNRLSPPYRKSVVTLGLLGGVVFTGLVAWMSTGLVWDISQTDQTSEELEWPMWVVYLCIPLGSSLMCFRFLQVIVQFWRHGTLPEKHLEVKEA